VEEHFVWMTTRQLKPGTLVEFERAWRPDTHPEGMLRAYAYWSADEREIIGVSFWASPQLCEAWRSSESEARRRLAMAAFVVGEQERFYRGPCGNCDNDLASAKAAQAEVPFAVGARVMSERWGQGTVQRYDGDHVTVLFDEHGYRELFVPVVLERGLLRLEPGAASLPPRNEQRNSQQ